MELKLNFDVKVTNHEKLERVAAAETAVKKAKKEIKPLAECWTDILTNPKLADRDRMKLLEVIAAMDAGKLGREAGAEKRNFSKAEGLRLYKVWQELSRAEKLEDLAANTPDNYILVQDEATFDSMMQDMALESTIAVDTETTGINVYTDKIVGISLTAPSVDRHYYIPIRHNTPEKQLPVDYVLRRVGRLLAFDKIDKVFHNASFDLHMFLGEGIRVGGKVHCTQVMMHLLNENEMSYRLKDLVTKYCGLPSDTFEALFGKDCQFAEVELKYARYYAAKDTHVTWLLYSFIMKHMNTEKLAGVKKLYEKVERPLIQVVVDMERVGFVLDLEEVKRQEIELEARKEELEGILTVHFGKINFNSTAQLAKVIYDEKKLYKHLPPNWKRSTDSKTLKILARHDEGCKLLLEYKDLVKQLTGFVQSLPNHIQPDGRVHGQFRQTGTVTGRFSSTNPNLQQQSKGARKMFTAPDGYVILGADFKAQEPRLLTHFTQEPALIEIYEKGLDLYAQLAARFYKRPYEEVYKNADGSDTKERKVFKIVVLAIMYGMSNKALAQTLNITEMEAEEIIDDFYEQYGCVAEWIEQNKADARNKGYVETLFYRKRRLPEARSLDKWTRLRAERQATNARIQGSAADQTKLVMIAADAKLKAMSTYERQFNILASVHDELLFLVPEDVTQAEVDIIRDLMTQTVILKNVESGTDIEIGKVWGNMMSEKDWFKTRAAV